MNNIIEKYGYYPLVSDADFQSKLMEHTEFNELIHIVFDEKDLSAKEKIDLIKSKLISTNLILMPHQEFVSRFISSYTPYRSLLLYHSPGSGKTLSVLKILKNNIDFIINQNSMIYIVVPRKILKLQWINEINRFIPEMKSYIKILTHKSLYNKTIGEKKLIVDKINLELKRVHNSVNFDFAMDNSILVLEEAHNLTNNNYTDSITFLKNKYSGLKILALSATPIKNHIDEIIDIFNFLRDDKLEKKDYFKYEDGKPILVDAKRLQKDITGYISTLKINDSIYLSKKIEVGEFTDGLEYIKVIELKPTKIQSYIVENILKIKKDSLGRVSESLSNIYFPFINSKGKLVPVYGNTGYNIVLKLVKDNPTKYNTLLCDLLNITDHNLLSVDNDKLSGKLFSLKYIKTFSIKIYFIVNLLLQLSGNVFIYSNYKLIMIDVIREVLLNEGFEEYGNPDKGIESQKRCYNCYQRKIEHTIFSHTWSPARFFICDSSDTTLMDKINTFNTPENLDGKLMKLILSSRMIEEGISLKNVIHVIKLDASLTMSRNEQIERRAIRLNSHNDYILKNNRIPNVYVYNIAVRMNNGVSNEINNYKIAERKYKNIIEIDKVLVNASIDINVYNSKTKYKGKVNNMTHNLVEKDNRIDTILKYLTNLLQDIYIIKFQLIYDDISDKFNNISIIMAFKYLNDKEQIFITKISEEIYIISNLNTLKIDIDEHLLDITKYYNIDVTNTEIQYFYDIEYLISKTPASIRGILNNKFKIKFNNSIIDKLKLKMVKVRNVDENISLLKGWICNQSINKKDMIIISNFLNLKYDNIKSTCRQLQDYFYNLEKYNNTNIQYLIYPKNHESIKFPLNIYDNYKSIISNYESKGYTISSTKNKKVGQTIKSFDGKEYEVIQIIVVVKKNDEELTITI